jgi:hypothetical protein
MKITITKFFVAAYDFEYKHQVRIVCCFIGTTISITKALVEVLLDTESDAWLNHDALVDTDDLGKKDAIYVVIKQSPVCTPKCHDCTG